MKSFFLSLVGHLILISLLVFYMTWIDPTKHALAESSFIKAYPVSQITTHSKEFFPKNKFKIRKNTAPKSIIPIKNYSRGSHQSLSIKQTQTRAKNTTTTVPLTQERRHALLSLLHQKISDLQTYPETARLLHQTGTVSFGFNLFPDGHLEKIAMLKSSGSPLIDGAALTALKAIMPVKEAKNYLQQAAFFSVDIVFE